MKEKDDDARQWSTRDPAIADGRRRRRHDGTGDLDKPGFATLAATGIDAVAGVVRRECLHDLRRSEGPVPGPGEALPAISGPHVQRGEGREARRHGVPASVQGQKMELLHRPR